MRYGVTGGSFCDETCQCTLSRPVCLFYFKPKESEARATSWLDEYMNACMSWHSTRCWFELQFSRPQRIQLKVSRHQRIQLIKMTLTRTWFEHATFWSGVRRATVAPPGLLTTGQSDARRSPTHIARASNPSAVLLVDWRFETRLSHAAKTTWFVRQSRSHGVMVSTLDFESSDPSSNLGGTSTFFRMIFEKPLYF